MAKIQYRDENYSLQILLSRSQAGPVRIVKQEQEEISSNHVQRINLTSVCLFGRPNELPTEEHIINIDNPKHAALQVGLRPTPAASRHEPKGGEERL